jgi:hypothetical protein
MMFSACASSIHTMLGESPPYSLNDLGNIAKRLGDQEEAHRCYTDAVRIMREIGVPIAQWLIDEGY